jgi:tetratricopeptide (TPR) repeat protein
MADIATLEEERDLLLRSLEDLEAEYEAGDLDQVDYETLRDDYTARAAAVIRRLDQANDPSPPSEPSTSGQQRVPFGRRAGVVLALGAFAVLAGLFLARTAGERGVNDQITGSIDESSRTRVVRCQELGSSGGDLVGALECFDELLLDDPENAEALAYRGWYLLLASGSLQQSAEGSAQADADAAELLASGLEYLDRSIDADPSFPDPLAFRASVYDRLGESELACADIATLLTLDPPEFFLDQTTAIADRNNC